MIIAVIQVTNRTQLTSVVVIIVSRGDCFNNLAMGIFLTHTYTHYTNQKEKNGLTVSVAYIQYISAVLTHTHTMQYDFLWTTCAANYGLAVLGHFWFQWYYQLDDCTHSTKYSAPLQYITLCYIMWDILKQHTFTLWNSDTVVLKCIWARVPKYFVRVCT